MATTKPDYTYKWASDGDKIAPSNAKIQTGWSPEIPPYQWENWIQNRQDEMLAHINERGIAEWDNKTDYVGGGKSYVQGSDGKVYKSVTASGPTTTVQDPVTDSTDTYWTIAFADRANNLSDLTNAATARTNLGLGTAATANLTTFAKTLLDDADAAAARATLGVTVPDGGLGYGQTWQNVKASRASGVNYTNTSGKPIMVIVQGDAASPTVTVSGLNIVLGEMDNDYASFIVPAGATYSVSVVFILTWSELR